MKRLADGHPDEDMHLRPDFVPLLDGIVGESRALSGSWRARSVSSS